MDNFKNIDKLKLIVRKFIYSSIYFLDVFIVKKNPDIFILCYHSIAEDKWRFSINFETLKKQVEYLLKKYKPVSLEDIEQHIQERKKIVQPSFAICFDDGYKDVYQTKDYFKRMGIQPALFVLSDRKNANREELETNRGFLNSKEILELKISGWIIGSHGATHSDFFNLTDKQLEEEVVQSKKDLEKELGIRIKYLAYPKGRYNLNVLKAVKKASYSLGLSMNDGFMDRKIDPLLIPRVGVDRTHSFLEFKSIFMPSAIKFRRFVKTRIGILV